MSKKNNTTANTENTQNMNAATLALKAQIEAAQANANGSAKKAVKDAGKTIRTEMSQAEKAFRASTRGAIRWLTSAKEVNNDIKLSLDILNLKADANQKARNAAAEIVEANWPYYYILTEGEITRKVPAKLCALNIEKHPIKVDGKTVYIAKIQDDYKAALKKAVERIAIFNALCAKLKAVNKVLNIATDPLTIKRNTDKADKIKAEIAANSRKRLNDPDTPEYFINGQTVTDPDTLAAIEQQILDAQKAAALFADTNPE